MTETDKRAGRIGRFHERFLVEERVVVASGKRNLHLIAVGWAGNAAQAG